MNNSQALSLASDFHMDGMTNTPLSIDNWYWTNTGKKISFTILWAEGEPNSPYESCLSFKTPSTGIGINDTTCQYAVIPFVCQRIDFYVSK